MTSSSEWETLRAYFVGRSTEKRLLLSALESPQKNAHVIVLHGPAGVGKSSLLREYQYLCNQNQVLNTFVDCRDVHSTVDLATRIRSQLPGSTLFNRPFREFDAAAERLKKLRRAVPGVDGEGTLPEKIGVEAIKGGVGAAVGTVAGMAIAGPAGAIVGGGVGAALGPIIEKVANRGIGPGAQGRGADDLDFLARSDDVLSQTFLNGIRAFVQRGTLVILFDNYSRQPLIDSWLCKGLLPEFLANRVIIVIAGRERPDPSVWTKYLPISKTVLLQPFKDKETASYFRKRGIRLRKAEREQAHLAMAGLPLGIALLADLPQTGDAHFLENFEKQEIDVISRVAQIFVQQITDDKLRRYIWLTAVPTVLTSDALSILVPPQDVPRVLDQLQTYGSLVSSVANGMAYHDAVRHYLISEMKRSQEQLYRSANRSLASYYEHEIVGLHANRSSWTIEHREQLATSRLYHSFESDLDFGLRVLDEEFDAAWHQNAIEFCEQILSSAIPYFPAGIPDKLKLLSGITAIARASDDQSLYVEFNRLYHEITDLQSKATIGKHLSRLLSLGGKQEQAQLCLDECRIIYEQCGDVDGATDTVRLMAEVYEELGRSERALVTMRSITESSASLQVRGVAYFRMGIILRRQGQVREALTALRSAETCLSQVASVGTSSVPQSSIMPGYTMRENIEILIALGDIYHTANRWGGAFKEYTRARVLLEEGRTEEQIRANKELFWRLALIKLNLGACHLVEGRFDEAKTLFTYAIMAFTSIKNFTLLTLAYRGTAQYHLMRGEWQECADNLLRALDLAQNETRFPRHIAQILISLSDLEVERRHAREAKPFCDEAGILAAEHKYQDLIARQKLSAIKIEAVSENPSRVAFADRLCTVLAAGLKYNSYLMDELLLDMIDFFGRHYGDCNAIFEDISSCWINTESNGRPIIELETEIRARDRLDDLIQPTVVEQLQRFSRLSTVG